MNIRVAQENFGLRLDVQRSVAIREGDIVILYPQSLHMDPDIYEEPQVRQPNTPGLPEHKSTHGHRRL